MVSRKSAKKKARKERAEDAKSKPQIDATAHEATPPLPQPRRSRDRRRASSSDPDEVREKLYELIEEATRKIAAERERETAPIYQDEDYGVKYGHYVDSGGNLWYWGHRAWYERPGLWIVVGVAVSAVLVFWMFF
ncbi:hypothetical protein [Streptomyces albicerus]|uniref:hypothetical protein n=1 Tax=Streptomyces albicerus TaxID=2569859 RepID=UPI00124B5E40|nr:hypothetical protein [Streptomyces albicerus]